MSSQSPQLSGALGIALTLRFFLELVLFVMVAMGLMTLGLWAVGVIGLAVWAIDRAAIAHLQRNRGAQ